MELSPGTVLRNAYRIQSVVARGRHSIVYRCFDLKNPRVLALKDVWLEPGQAGVDDRVAQLRAEFATLSRLNHANLPRVWDYFEESGHHCFVIDYVQATPLHKVVEAWGAPPSPSVLLNWLVQLLNVLEYLHTQQPPVIFRNICPANIMAMSDGYLKLVDFDIAKILMTPEERTRFREEGAAEYSPLEHFSQSPSGALTDIYSLGATLYFLSTLHAPPKAPRRARGVAPLEPIRDLNPAVPEALENAIVHMMAVMPEDRPQSIAEVRLSLAGVLDGVSSTPVPVPVQAVARAEHEARSSS